MQVNPNLKVMGSAPPDNDKFSWEFIWMGISAAVGLLVKLSILFARKNVNWKDKLRDFALAGLSTFIVINFCIGYQVDKHFAYAFIALSARYSDFIIMLAFNTLKGIINKIDPFE